MAGKGSVLKRGKDSWRLQVNCGMDAEDKQIRKTKTIHAASKKEAEKELAKFIAEIEKGQFIEPTKLTFADFTYRWLRDYAEKNLAPKTVFRYKQILKSRVLPAMGYLKIEKITPVHLMEFYANLQEDGIREDGKSGVLSAATILYHHRVISSILNDAVQWQVIASNPASRVKPPKGTKIQAACYDEEQTAALLEALEREDIKYKVMVHLALFTGLRRGELMGLEWQDLNFEKNILDIRQASQYLPGQGTFTKKPKNQSSVRFLCLPSSLMALLKQYKAHQAEERLKAGIQWQGSERIFTTQKGGTMHPDTVSRWFPKFLKRQGLPELPFHGLRHTAATMLINQGLPAKSISGRMGHSNIGTTFDIYGHYLKSADRESADRLEEVYQKMKDNKKKETIKGQI